MLKLITGCGVCFLMILDVCASHWVCPCCPSLSTLVVLCLHPQLFSMASVQLSFHLNHIGPRGIASVTTDSICSPTTLYSVYLCGFWNLRPSLHSTPDSSITALLQSLSDPLLYVGFGSMESYLPDVDWTNFFATLEEGD